MNTPDQQRRTQTPHLPTPTLTIGTPSLWYMLTSNDFYRSRLGPLAHNKQAAR